jgi:hypothetical protein
MHYATLQEVSSTITEPNYSTLMSLPTTAEDKALLLQISKGEVYLTPEEQKKLWTVSNPLQLQEMLSSKREKALGGEACKQRNPNFDKWSRPANINSINYFICPGDNPSVAISRENNVTRLAYPDYPVYPTDIPLGLTSQRMGMNSMTETFPATIPLINMGELIVPYGLTNMMGDYFKNIPQGLKM